MDGGATSAKSILGKPLKLLTEEEISQLTREDCRKFLKEKGMRRPSWNKSQAIQQVLSLKALLEPGEDSGAGILRKILVSQPPNPTRAEPTNELGAFQEDDGSSHRRDSPTSAEFSGGGSAHYVADKDSYKTRSPAETSALDGQMTIFYSGIVNVYDGVPPEKARSIMHFAANLIDLPENGIFAASRIISRPMSKDAKGQANRKVSLQRYLEKRKDRRLFKTRKAPGVASPSLEMYLNRSQPPVINAAAYSQNLSAGTGGEQHHVVCESPENQIRSSSFSVDLNSDINSEDI